MPFTSGKLDIPDFPQGDLEEAWRDREAHATDPTKPPRYIPLWDDSLSEAQAPAAPSAWLHGEAPFGSISKGIQRSTAAPRPGRTRPRSRASTISASSSPGDYIARIAPRSLLYVAGITDVPDRPRRRITGACLSGRTTRMRNSRNWTTAYIENYFRNFKQALGRQLDYLKRRL